MHSLQDWILQFYMKSMIRLVSLVKDCELKVIGVDLCSRYDISKVPDIYDSAK